MTSGGLGVFSPVQGRLLNSSTFFAQHQLWEEALVPVELSQCNVLFMRSAAT